MLGVSSRSSCGPIIKALKILMISSLCTLSLMTILAHDFEYFTFNNLINSTCTRRLLQLHKPVKNLALYQTGVYYKSLKISNILPKCTADLVEDKKQSVQSFRSILIEQSFNSIYEFLDYCVTQCSGCVMKNSSLCMLCCSSWWMYYIEFHCLMSVFCVSQWHDWLSIMNYNKLQVSHQ